jgi:hypothetical protein
MCVNEMNRAAAREFRARPIGQHSPALAHLLSRLRAGDVAEKYCLISIKPHSEWAIGVLSGTRGVAPRLADSQVFHSLEAAEWEVFKRRWAQVFGTALDEELP